MSVNNSLVCYLLEKYGSDKIKNKYLPELASGKARCIFFVGASLDLMHLI